MSQPSTTLTEEAQQVAKDFDERAVLVFQPARKSLKADIPPNVSAIGVAHALWQHFNEEFGEGAGDIMVRLFGTTIYLSVSTLKRVVKDDVS